MTEERFLEQVRIHIRRSYGKMKEAAAQRDCSVQYISGIVTGRKSPPKWLLDEMGIERITKVEYRRIKR